MILAIPHRAGLRRLIAPAGPTLICRSDAGGRAPFLDLPAVHPDQARQRLPAPSGRVLVSRDRLSFPAADLARVATAFVSPLLHRAASVASIFLKHAGLIECGQRTRGVGR